MADIFNPQDPEAPAIADAVALLKSDHRKVEDLFVRYQAASETAEKTALAHRICVELKVHTQIEEEIFYPALRGAIQGDVLDEAYVEHDGAKVLVNDIAAGSADDDYYDAKVAVLSEEIKHHVREEEMPDRGMFALARGAGVDLIALGGALKARKEELTAQAEQEGLPPAEPAVVNLAPA